MGIGRDGGVLCIRVLVFVRLHQHVRFTALPDYTHAVQFACMISCDIERVTHPKLNPWGWHVLMQMRLHPGAAAGAASPRLKGRRRHGADVSDRLAACSGSSLADPDADAKGLVPHGHVGELQQFAAVGQAVVIPLLHPCPKSMFSCTPFT